MDWQNIDWNHAAPYIVPVLVVALLARRVITNKPRPVKIGTLFIWPLIAFAGVIGMFAVAPAAPPLFWILGFVVALALGAGIGFLTSHHQEFAVDPEHGTITSRATPIGSILVVALFALRYGLKFAFPQLGGGGVPQAHPSADVLAWADAGVLFSAAMLTARAVTTWLRTRPLIQAHRSQTLPPAA